MDPIAWRIRRLNGQDAGELFQLRSQSLLDSPHAFLAAPGDDVVSSEDAARELLTRDGEDAVLGACAEKLCGMLGMYRSAHRKSAHKLYCWGMYVQPDWRRRGIGAALLAAAIHYARSLRGVASIHLSVSEAAPAACRLYQRAGFKVWGVEPDAIRLAAQCFDEHHLVMKLPAD